MTSDLKIPKQEVPVEILLIEQDTFRKCTFFLSRMSATHHGEETVSEFLNSEHPFVPARCEDDGVILLHLENVVAVRTEEESPETEGRKVHIGVRRGQMFDVQQVEPMPPGYDRTVDYLNLDRRFLGFREGNGMLYLHKHHMVQVIDQ